MKPTSIKTAIPEINMAQWSYLYGLLADQLNLTPEQRHRLADLLGVTR